MYQFKNTTATISSGRFNGRPDTDLMYYIYTYEIENVIYVESTLRHMLKEYRQNVTKDVYVMQFSVIHELVNDFCENYHNVVTPIMNKAIKNNIDAEFD